MEKIHGVNLGNWLVLEKWMNPDLFAGVDAEDELFLCKRLPREELEARMKKHRDTYITAEDFKWIKAHGLNTVRIPVPHFIFGDDPAFCDPYVPCIEYLDKAFDWADETGLKILIDLHTAPDSANGFDNGGICGVCKFAQKPENEARVIKVLGMLSERYMNRDSLFGVQILNEPVSPEMFDNFIKKRYKPHDPEYAEGSAGVPFEFLCSFYKKAYHEIRKYLGEDKVVMFHDGFRPLMWKEFMQTDEFKNVWLDTHIYMMMHGEGEAKDFANMALGEYRSKIREMSRFFPVVVGEWCIFHPAKGLKDMTPWEKKLSYRLVADAQLTAWDESAGFFFWSYKLMSDAEGWDYRRCVENGWIPEVLGQ